MADKSGRSLVLVRRALAQLTAANRDVLQAFEIELRKSPGPASSAEAALLWTFSDMIDTVLQGLDALDERMMARDEAAEKAKAQP